MQVEFLQSVSPFSNPKPHSEGKGFLRKGFPRKGFLRKGFPRVLVSTHITNSPELVVTTDSKSSPNLKKRRSEPRNGDQSQRLYPVYVEFEYKIRKGHKPDLAQSTQLFYDLCSSNKHWQAYKVMVMMVGSGTIPDSNAYDFSVNILCKRGHIGYAMELIEKMEKVGCSLKAVTYCKVFRSLCIHGKLQDHLEVVDRWMQEGFITPVFAYPYLLDSAYKVRGVDEVVRLLEEIIANGGQPSLFNYNVLLNFYALEGRTEDAIRLFRSLPAKGFVPDEVSYDTLLTSLCSEGRWEDANELLAEMGVQNQPVSSPNTFRIFIKYLARHGRTAGAVQVLEEMIREGLEVSTEHYNPIIAQLCKEGKIDLILKYIEQMVSMQCTPNDNTYSAIAVLCGEGKFREAFFIIKNLVHKQFSTLRDCYKNVLSSLCKGGNTYAAFQLLNEMAEDGFTPDAHTISFLIRGLCMEGMIDVAKEIFTVMEENDCRPDIDNYNALLVALCKSHRTDQSFEVFETMVEKGYMPNGTTYYTIVEGLAREEELEIATEVLRELYQRHVMNLNTVERLVMMYHLDFLQPFDWVRKDEHI